jgi:hypothetical protein
MAQPLTSRPTPTAETHGQLAPGGSMAVSGRGIQGVGAAQYTHALSQGAL